jgi:hypothetical protein
MFSIFDLNFKFNIVAFFLKKIRQPQFCIRNKIAQLWKRLFLMPSPNLRLGHQGKKKKVMNDYYYYFIVFFYFYFILLLLLLFNLFCFVYFILYFTLVIRRQH